MTRLNHSPIQSSRRCGAVAVLVVVTLVVLIGCASLAIDVGYLYNVRSELQHTADAAALAAAQRLPDQSATRETAQEYADLNNSRYGSVVSESGIVLGAWNPTAAVFTPGGPPVNAVHVLASRSNAHGNPVRLYFAGIFGITQTEVSASATAVRAGYPGRVRFLIDNETFDTDEPVLEDLAARLGTTTADLLSDGDGDRFVDIPGGEVLEMPTGQVGDEGLFAVGPQFEFTKASSPSLVDFLLYNESGNRRGITDSDLDPLAGVEPVSDPAAYPNFVDPDFVHVSPLYKSDVSNTEPWVNAKGLRYGLLAYRIIGVGADPDGGGSRLPNLIFQIVDPTTIDLNAVSLSGGSATAQLVE